MNTRQTGLSLLEVIISLSLGLLLVSASLHLYLGAHQAERSQAALAQVQDTGNLVTAILARELRHAGYRGPCLSTPRSHLPTSLSAEHYRFDRGVQAWSRPPAWLERHSGNGDVLQVRHARLTAADHSAGQLLLASDALGCDLFQSLGGRTPMPSSIPRRGQALQAFSNTVYFIEPGVSGLPALKRLRLGLAGARREELVDGVWSMQFLFAQDTAVLPTFVAAEQVNDWSAVSAVLLRILVVSQEADMVGPDHVVAFAGQRLKPPQRRLAKVFQYSVRLRNPWPGR